MSFIYEDVLPTRNLSTSPNTISERQAMHNYKRSILFPKGDGQDINLNSNPDSLLTHVKFMDLNPYNTYKFSNNPYAGLPKDYLLYRACYPIRQEYSKTTCARDSTGMNIRIYKLTVDQYNASKNRVKDYLSYDVWRELAYYEYVREQIFKKYQTPNFVNLIGYYISEKSEIDFDKLDAARNNITAPPKYVIQKDKQRPPFLGTGYVQVPVPYKGQALVMLTESPLYSIYGWATKTYQDEGNVKHQVNSGYHQESVWFGVLFQLMTALYAMQIHKLVFNNFSMEDNVYIKDLSLHGNVTNYWKYKVDGIDYYIPNHGYLLLVDSSYKDLPSASTTIITTRQPKYKISGKAFETKNASGVMTNDMTDKELYENAFEVFKRVMNNNSFSGTFITNGGVPPPTEVSNLLDKIATMSASDTKKDIGAYISKFMSRFMNNRIGTYLRETEVSNVRKNDPKDYSRGEMVVYEEAAGTYKFVVYNGEGTPGIVNVMTTEGSSKEITSKQIPVGSVYGYSKAETISQNFKINEANLNEDDLLETYILNKE